MTTRELISDSMPPVKPNDPAVIALDWMNEFKVAQLPVVDQGDFQGLITEQELLDALDPDTTVGQSMHNSFQNAYIRADQHLFEALRVIHSLRLDLLPVLGQEREYLGLITLHDLIHTWGGTMAIQEPGGVIVLEVPPNGYTLGEIGRIAESEDAKILAMHLDIHPLKGTLEITLKLNIEDISRVIAAYERFRYKIVRTHYDSPRYEGYRRNFEALKHYLD